MSNSTTELPFGWSSTTWGFIAAVTSCFFFGSYNIFFKIDTVQKLNPDPLLYQFWMNVSIFISSWLILSYNEFIFTWWAFLSASLWVTSTVFAVFAVKFVGMPVAQGVWSIFSIIISIIWGSTIFQQHQASTPLCALAVVFIAAGIAGITISQSDLLDKFFEIGVPNPEEEKILQQQDRKKQSQNSNLHAFQISWTAESSKSGSKSIMGIVCASVFGLTNGTMLTPMKFSPTEQGITYMLSFCIGVILFTIIFAFTYVLVLAVFFDRKPVYHMKILPLAGMGSGILWNIGFWSCIYATLFLGFNVGYPVTQMAIFFNGFWSIALFKKGNRSIGLFCFSSLILIGGALLLGFYGRTN